MKKVDFFIIGAPKCGTTSLAEYLKTHPQIVFSQKKEPNFFSSDFAKLQKLNDVRTLQDYLGLFRFQDNKVHGEASTTYLFSKEAIGNILRHNPAARMIAMLRNPVDMIAAWHTQKVKEKQEDELDFEAAWKKQDARMKGREIPALCVEEQMLFYKQWGLLGEQIQRLREQVPRQQCHIILLEDFIEKPLKVYREVLAFLGVPDDGRTEFKKYNTYQECRSQKLDVFRVRLHRFRKRNVYMRAGHRLATRMLPGRGLGVQKLLLSINYRPAERRPIDEGFRQHLMNEFSEDICLLERLIGRDLGPWKMASQ